MSMNMVQRFVDEYAQRIEAALKLLLEEKHLYQGCDVVDADALWEELTKDDDWADLTTGGRSYAITAKERWLPKSEVSSFRVPSNAPSDVRQDALRPRFESPTIKVYCSPCERREAHNGDRAVTVGTTVDTQTFALSYVCQSCKGPATIFLVRRRGTRLTLCGRAPIEQPDVSNIVPKDVRKFFGNALVAYRCGQVLAADALLRVCVEQFVRGATGQTTETNTENLFDVYNRQLDPFVRERCPSLRTVYGSLSEALHSALEDEHIFERAREDVELHFEGLSTVSKVGRRKPT